MDFLINSSYCSCRCSLNCKNVPLIRYGVFIIFPTNSRENYAIIVVHWTNVIFCKVFRVAYKGNINQFLKFMEPGYDPC